MKQKLLNLLFVCIIVAVFSIGAESPQENSEVKYPDPQRWTEEIKKFQEWDSKNTWPKDAVLFFGSSSIRLWNTAESFLDLPVINRGFGGSYTADALYYVNELVIKYKPKVVVIYEGDNDIAGCIPPEMAYQDFKKLVDAIHTALPDAEIICLSTKLCSSRWDRRTEVQELNELNKKYSDTKNYITFVDVAAVLLGADHIPKDEFFLSDQLHLNEKGYAQWSALLTPLIKERYSIAIKKSNEQ